MRIIPTAAVLALLALAPGARAQLAPPWWAARSILTTNAANQSDFSPLLQGQLKALAVGAHAEMTALLGDAGTNLNALVAAFDTDNNFKPALVGQVKYVAAPFYDRLHELGLTNAMPPGIAGFYPWSGQTETNDWLVALAGQAKYCFSFDLWVDSDGEGLKDLEELRYGTDRFNPDSDGDGRSDYDEVHGQPATDPLDPDSDDDLMPDGWEVAHELDPNDPNDAGLDPDQDNLSNLEEYRHRTDPQNPDTDGDGLLDGDEVYIYGSDPTNPDSDGDGMPDGWEVAHGFNPAPFHLDQIAAWWRLDETGGTVAGDSGTNGFDALILNATHVPGQLGYALSFGVPSNAVAGVTNPAACAPPALTLALRVNLTALTNASGGAMLLAGRRNAGNGWAYAWYKTPSNAFVFELADGAAGVTTRLATADSAAVIGDWVHLVGTYDGTNAAAYVNTNLFGGQARAQPLDFSTDIGPILGAATPDGATNRLAGRLDDVLILNAALDADQVAALDEFLGDADGDGLPNGDEYKHDTDPGNPDSDGDGYNDGDETHELGSDPTNPTDGAAMRAVTKRKIKKYWNVIYPTPLVFTNAPGSAEDRHDMSEALNTLSGRFFKPAD